MGDKSPKQKNKQQRQKRDEKNRKAEQHKVNAPAPDEAGPAKDKR